MSELKREQLLKQAIEVCGESSDRHGEYGTPEQNFTLTAKLWGDYLGIDIKPHQVCILQVLFKIARGKTGQYKDDTYIDMLGYTALGAEIENNSKQ